MRRHVEGEVASQFFRVPERGRLSHLVVEYQQRVAAAALDDMEIQAGYLGRSFRPS
jgi:hypothetical protein